MMSLLARTCLALVVLAACSEPVAGEYVYDDALRPVDERPDDRVAYTATPLLDGRILLAGGQRGEVGAREYPTGLWLFDPATGRFTASKAALVTGRSSHSAACLPDGRVVIAGGFHFDSPPHDSVLSVELYDPATDSITVGADALAPAWQIAPMPDGDLIGFNFSLLQEDELVIQRYLLAEDRWIRLAGDPFVSHENAQVMGLADGEVLVLGAMVPMDASHWPVNLATRYDPIAGRFHDEVAMTLGGSHEYIDEATVLADGRMLVLTSSLFTSRSRGLYLYDPPAHAFSTVMHDLPGGGMTIAALLDGRALLAGGQPWQGDDFGDPVDELRIFDPSSNSVSLLPTRLSTPSAGPTLAVSRRGPVFIAIGATIDLFE